MYKLYKEKCEEPVSYDAYRNVFNYHFNLSFYRPKKDQCDKCSLFKANKNPNYIEKSAYETHITEKKFVKSERDMDRSNIEATKAIICYDLQNVFPLPKGYVSTFYYKRKLSAFNLTATLILPNKKNITYCAIWNETMSGRSGNDIASALIKILKSIYKDNPEVKDMVLWSDSCVPQNRNKIMSLALLQFLHDHPSIDSIEQKFSEVGHSQIQEVDCIHSAIEKHLRGMEIPSPLSLLRYLKQMEYDNVTLKILQMVVNDFLCFSKRAEYLNFQCIPYSKCKFLRYTQTNLFTIEYKTSAREINYNSEILKISKRTDPDVLTKKFFQTKTNILPPRPLPEAKKKDIKDMLPFLPQTDRKYYETVLKI